ncbi:hypothetical protein CIPAW_05G148500 [Carya illinoinensis]|uniref:WAT1-related protein n=1 Tax=Carya illinoinensis TaxID=32201 RepID=A0A8T1QJ28_CARIL|nr:hypothetical protein CIPAW_05G148500 [Carya illinoinensis]
MRAMLWEAVPFTVMVTMEACTIGLTIWASTAMNNGMSPFVFVFYTNSLASILLPYSFIYHRTDRTEQPLLTFSLFLRFFFLGLTGITIAQNLAFLGLSLRSSSCQAKVIATLISIMGAVMVDLYKGPILILKTSVSSTYLDLQPKQQLIYISSSTPKHWILGFLLGTVKQYPELQVMKAASFYSVLGTVQCGIAVFGGNPYTVHIWCTQSKGPLYVPMFKPFGILFATIFGISFFTNNLHYGRTIIMGIGYYAMMWGQITGDGVGEDQCAESVDSLEEKTVLLLQEETQV